MLVLCNYYRLLVFNIDIVCLESLINEIQTQTLCISLLQSADFCYYASTVLAVEQRFEIEVGLWKELSSEMLRNSSVPLEEIYKVTTQHVTSRKVNTSNTGVPSIRTT